MVNSPELPTPEDLLLRSDKALEMAYQLIDQGHHAVAEVWLTLSRALSKSGMLALEIRNSRPEMLALDAMELQNEGEEEILTTLDLQESMEKTIKGLREIITSLMLMQDTTSVYIPADTLRSHMHRDVSIFRHNDQAVSIRLDPTD